MRPSRQRMTAHNTTISYITPPVIRWRDVAYPLFSDVRGARTSGTAGTAGHSAKCAAHFAERLSVCDVFARFLIIFQ